MIRTEARTIGDLGKDSQTESHLIVTGTLHFGKKRNQRLLVGGLT